MKLLPPLIGKRFTRLIVLERVGEYHRCRCDCGVEKLVRTDRLKDGTTKSCGCWARDYNAAAKEAAALARAASKPEKRRIAKTADELRLLHIYQAAVQRCTNPRNKSYQRYGGRGITVEFADQWDFIDWAKNVGYRQGLWLDRVDNDGSYSKSNCRFTTPFINTTNRENSLSVEDHRTGATIPISSVAKRFKYPYIAVYKAYINMQEPKTLDKILQALRS